MFKVKDVIEFLEGVKIAFLIAFGMIAFIMMGQTVEQPEWDLLNPTPYRMAIGCVGIVVTAQLIIWLIQFGSRDKPEPEGVTEKEVVDSVLANIQMAHDALNEAEQDYKRERHN